MPPFTAAEIGEVRGCRWENDSVIRYPRELKASDLEAAFAPRTACDWSVLALAYALRSGYEPVSPQERAAFTRAISANRAFVVAPPFLGRYDPLALVDPPPLSGKAISSVRIQYTWIGLGPRVDYDVQIQQADQHPTVSGAGNVASVASAQVQALARSLQNLVPVDSPFEAIACCDNYPDWVVELQFRDGTVMQLATHKSNLWGLGGPWQVKMGSQNYFQATTEFARAIASLMQALGLEAGRPAAMVYFGADFLSQAFPRY